MLEQYFLAGKEDLGNIVVQGTQNKYITEIRSQRYESNLKLNIKKSKGQVK